MIVIFHETPDYTIYLEEVDNKVKLKKVSYGIHGSVSKVRHSDKKATVQEAIISLQEQLWEEPER